MRSFANLITDDIYMQRCLQLAALGGGYVAPNPMVGAVLVHNNIIIGEGYHEKYGEAHAEVNCINSVPGPQKHLIKNSTLYVSLEPCNHFGKTPPCADLIIQHAIPAVVVACNDPFEKVNGSGIQKLLAAGIQVKTAVLEKEASWFNRRFFTFHKKQRPYIILKWAQANNLKIAGQNGAQVQISNDITNRLVHKWRSEEAAIMVGTSTALLDDPALTTRLWKGNHAIRIVVDNQLSLPDSLHLYDGSTPTFILNKVKQATNGNNHFHNYEDGDTLPVATIKLLQQQKIISLIVEGGAILLQSFINAGLWDEARIITNKKLDIRDGIAAPLLENQLLIKNDIIGTDEISYYKRNEI